MDYWIKKASSSNSRTCLVFLRTGFPTEEQWTNTVPKKALDTLESVRIKRPRLWKNSFLLHQDMLQFLAQKHITVLFLFTWSSTMQLLFPPKNLHSRELVFKSVPEVEKKTQQILFPTCESVHAKLIQIKIKSVYINSITVSDLPYRPWYWLHVCEMSKYS